MTDDKNYASPTELREIASLAEQLAVLADSYTWIDFDKIQVGDSNGEPLGVLTYESGTFLYRSV